MEEVIYSSKDSRPSNWVLIFNMGRIAIEYCYIDKYGEEEAQIQLRRLRDIIPFEDWESMTMITHCSHDHPVFNLDWERLLSGRNYPNYDEVPYFCKVRCYGCDERINDQAVDQAYGCVEPECNFYLHKSCAESPPKVQPHPFHPGHRLTLSVKNTNYGGQNYCKVCGNICGNFTYRCNFDECKFNMDIQCASLTPNIKYEGHEHLLTLVENIRDTSLFCEACGFRCVDFCVRCVECNINYHVQCGEDRLPTTINDENHAHPLTLINSHENDED